jgi:hypothetical protein
MIPVYQLLREIVSKKPFLFWDISDTTVLSDSAVVEMVLTRGDFDDFYQICQILGMPKVAEIFYHLIETPRHNFNKPTLNFFKTYFARHVFRNPQSETD